MLTCKFDFSINEEPLAVLRSGARCSSCGANLEGFVCAQIFMEGKSSLLCPECEEVLATAADILDDVKQEQERKEEKNNVSF